MQEMGTATLPEASVCAPDGRSLAPHRSWAIAIVVIAIATYLALAAGIAWTKAPWCDEGWFACPAYNLAFKGHLGTNVQEPSGHFLNAYLTGVQKHTYLNPPGHFVLMAGWFRIVGFSAFTMRLYSMLWSTITLVTLYAFVRRFAGQPAACAAVALTSIDFLFLWGSADGRTDAATGTLILAAITAYMFLRERSLSLAIAASQSLCALGWIIHPITFLGTLTVAVLAIAYDRRRLKWTHLIPAAIPYIAAFGLWGIYIAQSPSDFITQFSANAAGRNAARFSRILQPWIAVYELIVLYTAAYLSGTLWTVTMNPWMIFVLAFYLAAIIYVWRNRTEQTRVFRIAITTIVIAVTFLVGYKSQSYMVMFVPLHNALLAMMLIAAWRRGTHTKAVSVLVAATFAVVQLTTYVQHVRVDERHTGYRSAMDDLAAYRASGKSVTATTAAGVELGFDGFIDDARYGFYSKRTADVLLVERSYRRWIQLFETEEPQVFAHAVKTLTHDYTLTRRYGDFWIFERNTAPREHATPIPASYDALIRTLTR
jgi:4-amino-4-deoxy-L-arabinose transferase-like glycosyltransferase